MIDPISSVSVGSSAAIPTNVDAEQLSQATKTNGSSETSVRAVDLDPVNLSNPMNEGSVGNMMGSIHKTLDGYSSYDSARIEPSAVDSIKSEMQPDFQSAQLDGSSSNKSTETSMQMLENAFGRASFVAMVSQVVTGVGGAVKMLTRQS